MKSKAHHSTALPYLLSAIFTETDECIIWPFSKLPIGYGQINIGAKCKMVHRVAFERFNGISVSSKIDIRHTCNNPPCFNPRHLKTGTRLDNMKDSIDAGRTAHPDGKGRNKHSFQLIYDVREGKYSNISAKYLSSMIGMPISTINWTRRRPIIAMPLEGMRRRGGKTYPPTG